MENFAIIPYNDRFRPFHLFVAIAMSRSLGLILEENETEGNAFIIKLISRVEGNKIGIEELDLLNQISEYSPEKSIIQSIKASAQAEVSLFRGLSKYWRRDERQFWTLFLSELWTFEEEQKIPSVFTLFLLLKKHFSLKTIVDILVRFVDELLERQDTVKLTLADVSRDFLNFITGDEKIDQRISTEFLEELYRGKLEISTINTLKVYRLKELLIHNFTPHLILLEEKTMWELADNYLVPFTKEEKKEGKEKGKEKQENKEKAEEEIYKVFLGEALLGYQMQIISLLFSKYRFNRNLTLAEGKNLAKYIKKLRKKKSDQKRVFANHLIGKNKKGYFLQGFRLGKKKFSVLRRIIEILRRGEKQGNYRSFFKAATEQERELQALMPASFTPEETEAQRVN